MKRAAYVLWLFFLLIVVSRMAGRVFGTLGGGARGAIAALLVLAAAVMLYVVGAIVLSTTWAFVRIAKEEGFYYATEAWRKRKLKT